MINDHIQKRASNILEENCLRRKYSRFVRVYVRALSTYAVNRHNRNNEAILTLWDPTEDQLDLLQEGAVAQFRQLAVASDFKDGMLQLYTNKKSRIEKFGSFAFQEAFEYVRYTPPKVKSMLTINIESKKIDKTSPNLPEVDCSGYLLFSTQLQCFNLTRLLVYLTDKSGLMLRVELDDCCPTDSHVREIGKIKNCELEQRSVTFSNLRVAPFDCVQGCAVAIWTEATEVIHGMHEHVQFNSISFAPSPAQTELLMHKINAGIPAIVKTPQSLAIIFGYVVDAIDLGTAIVILIDCNDSEGLLEVNVPQHSWQSFLTVAIDALPIPQELLLQESTRLIKKRLVESSTFLRFVVERTKLESKPFVYLEANRVKAADMIRLFSSDY